MKFVVGTRYFEKDLAKARDSLDRLKAFIWAALAVGAEKVYVAVNLLEDCSDAIQREWSDRVSVFPVTPWGNSVLPLNAILSTARFDLAAGCTLLLANVETKLTEHGVIPLMHYMGEHTTLVVGGFLSGHIHVKPKKGEEYAVVENATGRQVPWNTFALWNPNFLWKTGFPMIGDGVLTNPDSAGVEEVATIAILQKLYPHAAVKLVWAGDSMWDMSSFKGERLTIHQEKMVSKEDRPAAQLKSLELSGPIVYHF